MTRNELAKLIEADECTVALYRDSYRHRFEDILLLGKIEDTLFRFQNFRDAKGKYLVLVLERSADDSSTKLL